MKISKITLYIMFIISVCAIIIYYQITHHANTSVTVINQPGTIAESDAKPFGGDFTLFRVRPMVEGPDKSEKPRHFVGKPIPFSLADVRGKFIVLYFGYTYCPDVCPLGLSNIQKAIAGLGRDRDQFVPIFVTVDPARDTEDILSLYATNFSPSFIFFRGTEAEIEGVKNQYRVYAKKELPAPGADADAYLVNHSSYIYILDRDGAFIRHVPHDMSADEMQKIFVSVLLSKRA